VANKLFGALATTGGGSGALDSIKVATLSDGDIAIVADNTEEHYVYRYESSNDNDTNPESDPEVVEPNDNRDPGDTGAWILTDLSVEDLKVYGNAVIDGTLTQTGNAGFTGNVDIDGTLTFDGAGPAITEVLDEDDMASDSATKLVTQQSVKAYIATILGSVTPDLMAGMYFRPMFTWNSTSSIKISGFRMHANGTTEQILKSDAEYTFTFGSGGSNASSDDIDAGAYDWHYLFVDDTAIVANGDNEVDNADCFINSKTAPVWDADQLAWYNNAGAGVPGPDRCLGAFMANASNELEEFSHDGSRLMNYQSTATYVPYTIAHPHHVYGTTTATLTVPPFCTLAHCGIKLKPTGNTDVYYLYIRPTGSTATVGQKIEEAYRSDARSRIVYVVMPVACSTSQSIDMMVTRSDGQSQVLINSLGYYFPKGM